MILDAMETV
jgi:hypothetical protein